MASLISITLLSSSLICGRLWILGSSDCFSHNSFFSSSSCGWLVSSNIWTLNISSSSLYFGLGSWLALSLCSTRIVIGSCHYFFVISSSSGTTLRCSFSGFITFFVNLSSTLLVVSFILIASWLHLWHAFIFRKRIKWLLKNLISFMIKINFK